MTQNTIHLQQAVIPGRYLHRHPYLPSDRAVVDISDHGLRMFQQTPAPYWRAERTRRRQQEYEERGLDRTEYAEDHFTGSSGGTVRSEEHTSELQTLMRISYDVFCLKKKKKHNKNNIERN